MHSNRLVFTLLLGVAASLGVAGCETEEELTSFDGSVRQDGYALFLVENSRQQRNDVTVVVKNPEPGATYVLFYSPDAPKQVGWFVFDPNTKGRCGGDLGDHCRVGDYGYLVDFAKTAAAGENAPGQTPTELRLRDDRCGCDADRDDQSWDGYWAVMRVEQNNHAIPIKFDVWAKRVKDYVDAPDIKQLQ